MFTPAYILSKLSCVYKVCLVTLIHENLKVLNKYIKSVSKRNRYYICETFSNPNYKHRKIEFSRTSKVDMNPEMILLLKRLYCGTWEASTIIENLTYWSLPIGCANDFFVLTSNSYWFFLNLFTRSRNYTIYILLLLFMSTSLGNMILIAYNSNRSAQNVSGDE